MFVDLFDAVFERLDRRGSDEFGADGPERELVQRLLRERSGTPDGIVSGATVPLTEVVEQVCNSSAKRFSHPAAISDVGCSHCVGASVRCRRCGSG